MEQYRFPPLDFFVTDMPASRPADYYIGCREGSVYIDFENYKTNCIRLVRISFDGYGCCGLEDLAIPMTKDDSFVFKEIIRQKNLDQSRLASIIIKTLKDNSKLIWKGALTQYGLV